MTVTKPDTYKPDMIGVIRMDDLVSRQAAIDAVYKCANIFINNLPVMVDKADAYKALAELPSAQPEIIRCKDCKHYVIHTLFGRSQGWCERLCDEFDKTLARGTEQDDFCSRAERRTDEPDKQTD